MNDHPPIKTGSGCTPVLGIDIGRVIIDSPPGALADTGFFHGDSDQLLATPEVPGAIEAIGRLVPLFGPVNVWLVSKCGQRIQDRTLRWLDGHGFWARTAMLTDQARFVRARGDKAWVCAKLGITYFVDDRPDVLFPMEETVPRRYLFGPGWRAAPRGLTAVADWKEAEAAIREDFHG